MLLTCIKKDLNTWVMSTDWLSWCGGFGSQTGVEETVEETSKDNIKSLAVSGKRETVVDGGKWYNQRYIRSGTCYI